MTNELTIKYKWQGEELEISPSIVRRFISTSKDVNDQEVKDFMDLCVYQHLNPYIKEAYLVKYGREKANIITSKDVFDKRAFRDPKYDGEEITNNYKRGMNLMDLWVRTKIYHKGLSHPASDVTVYYSEYVGKKKDGTINRIWRTKPVTMLTKVSKAQGKREANPEELARLYLTEEFDQEVKPTESVIREVDITPKRKAKSESDMADEYTSRKIETEMEIEAEENVIEEAEVEEQEQAEMEFEPASDKQKDFIYGTNDKKGIVDSHLIKEAEVKRIGKEKDLSKEKASKILAWWWGDKDKNIIGEREKRERNPKVGKNDLERRGQLMQEVLDLMKENHIKLAEKTKMYKKYQKKQIQELATEELQELKELLESYTPDWK